MDISAIIAAFKDIIFPVFGAIAAISLITCIPDVAEDEVFYEDED